MGVVSLRDLLAILRTDKSRYVVIGKRSSPGGLIVPWMVRAIDGHTSSLSNLASVVTPVEKVHIDYITAICHGAR